MWPRKAVFGQWEHPLPLKQPPRRRMIVNKPPQAQVGETAKRNESHESASLIWFEIPHAFCNCWVFASFSAWRWEVKHMGKRPSIAFSGLGSRHSLALIHSCPIWHFISSTWLIWSLFVNISWGVVGISLLHQRINASLLSCLEISQYVLEFDIFGYTALKT